jgi:DNA invertase Pin-like site-specific DNA recombinase
MPRKKERMAGYIRFSDPSMPLDDATMDSQAKAICLYAQKEGYIYELQYEYREAISAYSVPCMERQTLLEALAAAKRREFDVFVVTEVRAISRRTVEIFVIYDLLQKCGVRLESIQEKFEDSAVGHSILSARASAAEVERETTYMRLQRGKRDRLESGNINGHNKPAYGYIFIDTEREAKAAYAINTAVAHIDTAGYEWTEPLVIDWMGDLCLEGWSCRKIAFALTEMGIPTPLHNKTIHGKPVSNVWHPSTVYDILTHRIYIGEVVANRYKRSENPRTKKINMVRRPVNEHVHLPEGIAPPLLTREKFEAIQRRLEVNKQEALRRNGLSAPKEEMGLLRAGHAKCGICGHTLIVLRRGNTYGGHKQAPQYACCRRFGSNSLLYNHNTIITMSVLDNLAVEKIREVLLDPEQVRQQIELRKYCAKPVVSQEDVEKTIANIRQELDNVFELARYATNDSTRERLRLVMEDLEKQQREAEALLLEIGEIPDEREQHEAEIAMFEQWVENVRPNLTNPLHTLSYEELRLAVHILGLSAIVYPMHGDYPFRYKLIVGSQRS